MRDGLNKSFVKCWHNFCHTVQYIQQSARPPWLQLKGKIVKTFIQYFILSSINLLCVFVFEKNIYLSCQEHICAQIHATHNDNRPCLWQVCYFIKAS